MSRPTIANALVWKELRQIAPLFWAVLGLGGGLNLLMITLYLFTSPGGSGVISPYSFIVMPIIFATGVGVLLVSVEKENRTLQWLQGMPVSSAQIAKTKLMVALVSLAAVWAISLLMLWLFRIVFQGQTGITKPELDSLSESYFYPILFPTVSFFLGFAGLALAWRVSSPIYALLLLVPVTGFVWIITELFKFSSRPLFAETLDSSSGGWGISVASWAVGMVAAAVYGWLASQRDLAARTASAPWLSLLGESTKSTVAPPQWWRWESVPQNSALLWQSARQNWLPWSMLTIVFFVGVWMCGVIPQIGGYNDDLSLRDFDRYASTLLALLLGTYMGSALGSLVFQENNVVFCRPRRVTDASLDQQALDSLGDLIGRYFLAINRQSILRVLGRIRFSSYPCGLDLLLPRSPGILCVVPVVVSMHSQPIAQRDHIPVDCRNFYRLRTLCAADVRSPDLVARGITNPSRCRNVVTDESLDGPSV